jgi:hypothetical protein
MNTQLPPPPAPPGQETPPTSRRTRPLLIAGSAIVTALLFVVALVYVDPKPNTTPHDVVFQDPGFGDDELVAAIADVVIADDPERFAHMCEGYEILGHEKTFSFFVEGYGSGRDPSAEEVFEELIGRCP